MPLLDLYAGETAFSRIKQYGLQPELFDYMYGASGGPKWFVLAGLDRILIPEWFGKRSTPLDIVGSSAGAFRFACYAQDDPFASINRLAERYSETVYSNKPTAREISAKAEQLLSYVMQENGVSQIVNNSIIRTHFIVSRCHGLTKYDSKYLQLAGLIASAGANAVSRNWLRKFYERYIFGSPSSDIEFTDPSGMESNYVKLNEDNLQPSLMASGSIPVVLEGVTDIPGAPQGMYRDGGIIDYHFDLQLGPRDGLVLYPHFFSRPIPGWFDKGLKRRAPHKASYDKVLMLVPSDEFVSNLPYGKIPDRRDFETMDPSLRIKYWKTVLQESNRLADAFLALIKDADIAERIKPIRFD